MLNDGREMKPLFASLQQANIAWSLASIYNELIERPAVLREIWAQEPSQPQELHEWAQAEAFSSTSLIYRTFTSVVLGRTEPFVSALAKINERNRSPHIKRAIGLLRNDEVRRLRNALGHGTFLAGGQVLAYRDRNEKRRISFRELDELNFAIWSIILMGWAASIKWVNCEEA